MFSKFIRRVFQHPPYIPFQSKFIQKLAFPNYPSFSTKKTLDEEIFIDVTKSSAETTKTELNEKLEKFVDEMRERDINRPKIDEFAEKVRQDANNPEEHTILKPPPIGEIYKSSQPKKEGVDEFAEKVREETMKVEEKEFQAKKDNAEDMLDLSNSQEYDKLINNSEKPIIVDFYKTDCANCKRLFPLLLTKYKNSNKDWVLAGANIDKINDIAKNLKIQQVPSVFLIHKGKVVDMVTTDDQKLDDLVNTANKLSHSSSKKVESMVDL